MSDVQWGVRRPDGVEFVQEDEKSARGYIEAGNADGLGRYRLLRRVVNPWLDVTDQALPCKACGCALADCDAYGEGCCPSCKSDAMHQPHGVHICTNPALCPLDPLVEYRDIFTGEIITCRRSQVKLGAGGDS